MKRGYQKGKHMFMNMEDLSGKQFGRLLALWCAGRSNCRKLVWSCQCDCGNITAVLAGDLKSGKTKSCGCLQPQVASDMFTTHGYSKGKGTREYAAYHSAKTRCTNMNNADNWKLYGGRGIEFRFTSFEEFINHIGPRPSSKHSLDRINSDGHYEIGNVRWATQLEQNRNQRRNVALQENELLRQRIAELEWCGATYADFALQGA